MCMITKSIGKWLKYFQIFLMLRGKSFIPPKSICRNYFIKIQAMKFNIEEYHKMFRGEKDSTMCSSYYHITNNPSVKKKNIWLSKQVQL